MKIKTSSTRRDKGKKRQRNIERKLGSPEKRQIFYMRITRKHPKLRKQHNQELTLNSTQNTNTEAKTHDDTKS